MSSKSLKTLLPMAALCAGIAIGAPSTAEAALIKLSFDGNDCTGALGTDPKCSFNKSPQILKYDTEEKKLSVGPEFPTIDGSEFEFSTDGTIWVGLSGLSDSGWGTGYWRYTPGEGDPEAPVRYWSAKAGRYFNVFFQVPSDAVDAGGACETDDDKYTAACQDLALNVLTGNWISPTGNSLSHILFLDTGGPPANGNGNGGGPGNGNGVPEPATLGLIGLGMLALGALRRRQQPLRG